MFAANEEKELKRGVSPKTVCAVAISAFVMGAVLAGGVGYAVSGNQAKMAESDGTAESADAVGNIGKTEAVKVTGAAKNGEINNVSEDAEKFAVQEGEGADTASVAAKDLAADSSVSEERQLFQEYLDEYLPEDMGTVDLKGQERAFDWYQTYPIYRMADGHMAWTNVSGVCGSVICDLDGDGAEELIVFELNGERLMGTGELSIHVYEVSDGRVKLETSHSQDFPSNAGGSELSWSLLQADDAVYVLYRHNYYGVSGGAAVTREAALYRYAAGCFYAPLRVERQIGEAGHVTGKAYQYDAYEELLSEEILYDGRTDAEQDRGRPRYEKRIEELFDEYGIHFDGEEAQPLLTLPVWVVSQDDFLAHKDSFDGQDKELAVYQRFLNGEGSVRIREGVWEGYDGDGNAEWTMRDLRSMVCDYYLDEYGKNDGRMPHVEYAWLDCGGDGEKELAIRFVGVGMESTEDLTMIIACRGAAAEVVYARHSWSRNSNELRYYGCISHHGSDGAMDNYAGMDYVNGKGVLQTVYSTHALGHQGGALRDLESYDDSIASAYAFTDITYGIGDTEYVVLEFSEDIPEGIRSEYKKYLDQKGRNVITQEEADRLIKQRAAQLGIRKEWMEGKEVLWSYCYW